MLKRFIIFLIIILLSACSPYSVRTFKDPQLETPLVFNNMPKNAAVDTINKTPWWSTFKDSQLDNLVLEALSNNLNLQAAWDRLRQAQEQAVIAGSEIYPQINSGGSASRSRLVNPELQGALSIDTNETIYFNDFAVRNGLSYEFDIWKRILSKTKAQEYRSEAANLDAQYTAQILTGTIANSWFNVNRLASLLKLIDQQTKSSATQLELTELRFSLGKGSALDVYQQREQLQSIKAEKPQIKSQFESSKNQLAVLLGKMPGKLENVKISGKLPKLPKFPDAMTPAELLNSRPDLIASRSRLQALEYDLASAVAERFPKLQLGLSYDFNASQFEDLFDRQRGSILGELILPIVDGGRRRAVVRLNKAQVDEQIKVFEENFITAIADTETALVAEKQQLKLVKILDKQLKYARARLRESQTRYSNGLTDYLQVTLALQSLQSLERRVVSEKANLLAARVQLHLALGGRWQPENKDLNEDIET